MVCVLPHIVVLAAAVDAETLTGKWWFVLMPLDQPAYSYGRRVFSFSQKPHRVAERFRGWNHPSKLRYFPSTKNGTLPEDSRAPDVNRSINMREVSHHLTLLLVALGVFCAGCGDVSTEDSSSNSSAAVQPDDANQSSSGSSSSGKPMGNMGSMVMPNPEDIVFKEEVTSNVEIPDGLNELVFVDKDGERVSLESYLGKKNLVLVFTEGFAGGMLCPFCKTQTARRSK